MIILVCYIIYVTYNHVLICYIYVTRDISSSLLLLLLFLTNSNPFCEVNNSSDIQNFLVFFAPLEFTAMVTTFTLE